MKIAYYCNGKNPKCKDSPWCAFSVPLADRDKDYCCRTQEVEYAANGPCEGNPSDDPDRFAEFKKGVFIEKDPSIRW